MFEVKRVLSIQSHVIHGYVGNRAATFPLQCLGWDVDVINTVNFSNHTGYGSVRGTKSTHEEINEVHRGLSDIGVVYDAFLTGYIHGAEALEAVGEIGRRMKAENPQMLWLLDPVMGDEGELYVSSSVIPSYRKILMQGGVDIITPNQFEAELLVDFAIDSYDALKRALEELHTKFRVDHVVISSLKIGDDKSIKAVTSHRTCQHTRQYIFDIPFIESYFTGVGDLFSALLLDRVYEYSRLAHRDSYLQQSVNESLSVMAHVLKVTSEAASRELGSNVVSKMGSADTMKSCELRLIQCRDSYSSREQLFTPRKL